MPIDTDTKARHGVERFPPPSDEAEIGKQIRHLRGNRFQPRLKDSGKAEQWGVNIKQWQLVSTSDESINAGTARKERYHPRLFLEDHGRPKVLDQRSISNELECVSKPLLGV